MSILDQIPLLNTLDRTVGKLLRTRSESGSELLELAGSFTSHALRQGHVCLDLNRMDRTELTNFLEGENLSDLSFKLRNEVLVGDEDQTTCPLILSKAKKLYFHRYWHYEQRLNRLVRDRLDSQNNRPSDSKKETLSLSNALGRDQQRAVYLATQSTLTLISGGPGTGKTTTVLYILAQLLNEISKEPLRIALAAPTGKAAQRIHESLTSGLERLNVQKATKERIPTEASTIHRLLGYQRNSCQFQHNQANPLPFDVVVVDEASMLDLLLFSKLLDALKPQTCLILLGDSHQLASVEAGSIFGDLIVASRSNTQLAKHTVELKENFRFSNNSSLYRACEYVKRGDSKKTLELLIPGSKEISLHDLPTSTRLSQELEITLAGHFVSLTQSVDPHEALQLMTEICLLTPLRKGIYGVDGLNATVETIVRKQNPGLGNQRHFNGKPILITENSYTQKLFNGDLGIVMLSKEDPNTRFAYFPNEEGDGIKRYPLTALPAFESAYAFTVHKSQGSEYGRVIFALPPMESPILSRELVYTAISRSRKSVEIWGQADTLTRAIDQQTQRTSGILDYLEER